MSNKSRPHYNALILVAEHDEFDNLRDFVAPDFGSWDLIRDPTDNRPLLSGQFHGNKAVLSFLIARSTGQGYLLSERRVRDLCATYLFDGAAMCGVCAGDPKKVKQSDIIAAHFVWRDAPGKVTRLRNNPKTPHTIREGDIHYREIFPDYWADDLREFGKDFLTRFNTRLQLRYPPDGKLPFKPKLHIANVQSVLDITLDDRAFDRANKKKRPTRGIEMEGIGVADACVSEHLEFFLMAKGVQDFARPTVGSIDKAADDIYRSYAASASALFVIEFLKRHLPTIHNSSEVLPGRPLGSVRSPEQSQAITYSDGWVMDADHRVFTRREGQLKQRIIVDHPKHRRLANAPWFNRISSSLALAVNVEVQYSDQGPRNFRFVTDIRETFFMPVPTFDGDNWAIDNFIDSVARVINRPKLAGDYDTYRVQAGIKII